MRFEALCIALLLPACAWAGSGVPAFPDDATLQRHRPTATTMPTDTQIKQAGERSRGRLGHFDPARVAVPAFPRIPAQDDKDTGFDEAVKNASKAGHAVHAAPHAPRLIIFVSLSMPRESLRRLAAQAARAGAAVALRGLAADAQGKPSFRATAMAVQRLGLREGGFSVDPPDFKRFGIDQVPAFVLLTQNDCRTCGDDYTPKHLTIYGDVSLDYALHAMESRRPEASALIRPYLERLKTGFFSVRGQGGDE